MIKLLRQAVPSKLIAFAASLAASWLAATTLAYACASQPAPACSPPTVFPDHGNVPANVLVFFYQRGTADSVPSTTESPHVYRVDQNQHTELRVNATTGARGAVLRVLDEVPAGALLSFEVEGSTCAQAEPLHTEYVVTDAATAPTTLGTLITAPEQHGLFRFPELSGSCTASLDSAWVDLAVRLAPDARPFRDVLTYELRVDGVATPPSIEGETTEPFVDARDAADRDTRGVARMYAVCAQLGRVLPVGDTPRGRHRVRMDGTLPDGGTVSTDEIDVELSCPEDAGVTNDAGAESKDAGRVDAGQDAGDRHPPTPREGDDEVDAGPVDDAPSAPHQSGCALRSDSGSSRDAVVSAFVLAALLRRRRRAR